MIAIGKGIGQNDRAHGRYNRNIRIEYNTFRGSDPCLLKADGVDGLTLCNNKVEESTGYPAQHQYAKPFELEFSNHARLEDPKPVAPDAAGAQELLK